MRERPYTGNLSSIQASSTASKDVLEKKVSFHSGEETGPTFWDISPLKLLTLLLKMPLTEFSSRESIQSPTRVNISSVHCFQEVLLVVSAWFSSILLTSQEQDSAPISESLKEKDNSTVSLTVAERLSPKTESLDCIKDSSSQFWVFSHIEPSISGK